MKRIVLIMLLFFTSFLLSSEDISFLLHSDLTIDPFFYEPDDNLYSFGLLEDLYVGASFNTFHLFTALNLQVNYYSFDGQNSAPEINGAFFNIKGLFYGEMSLNDPFVIGLGIGGTYLKTSFEKANQGFISNDHGGLSFKVNVLIDIPVSFLSMELRNELDLIDIFSQTSPLSPYYLGGVRINIAPHKNNISYFIHLSGMVFDYTDIAMDLKTGMFAWGAGISVRLPFHKTDEHAGNREDEYIESYKDEEAEKSIVDEGIDSKENDVEILDKEDSAEPENSPVNTKKVVDPLIESLSQMKNDETLSVPISLFTQSISELDENSLETLDKIIGFLKDHPEFAINITGYSYFIGDPFLEIEQSMKRAEIIKMYFISEGIEMPRIAINSKALLYIKNEDDQGPSIMITRIK